MGVEIESQKLCDEQFPDAQKMVLHLATKDRSRNVTSRLILTTRINCRYFATYESHTSQTQPGQKPCVRTWHIPDFRPDPGYAVTTVQISQPDKPSAPRPADSANIAD